MKKLPKRRSPRLKNFDYSSPHTDHLHLPLAPTRNGTTVSQFMNAFKSKSTRICWNHGIHGKVWQGRFYDHILRKSEDIKTVAEYILHNPVRTCSIAKPDSNPSLEGRQQRGGKLPTTYSFGEGDVLISPYHYKNIL